eukprot:Clim_evm56s225 gene=Clim_evmTU56s225
MALSVSPRNSQGSWGEQEAPLPRRLSTFEISPRNSVSFAGSSISVGGYPNPTGVSTRMGKARSDWVDWAAATVLVVTVSIICKLVPTIYRKYPQMLEGTDDNVIGYQYNEDTVSVVNLFLIIILGPLLTFGSCYYFRHKNSQEYHDISLAFYEGLSLVISVTEILKKLGGRLRPDFAQRLQSGDASVIAEGHLSFPSGHASMSFYAYVMISLYLAGTFHVWGRVRQPFWKFVLTTFPPMVVPGFISFTRVWDNRHNYDDILAGALIGSVIAFMAYHRHFHFILDPNVSGFRRFVDKESLLQEGEVNAPLLVPSDDNV